MRPELHFAVQIDTTLHRSESPVIHGFQRFALSFNRTVVKFDRDVFRRNSDRKCFFSSYFSRPTPSVAKHALVQLLHEVNR